MMFENLVKSLRICGDSVDAIDECCYEECIQHERPIDPLCMKALCNKAADAIEELSRAKEELAKQVAYWQARLTESMCGETQAELEKPRWIPVTEGFPKDRVPVQVCYIGMNTGTVESDLLACRYYGAWCYWDGEPCSYDECKVEITHWMPLTRPPKE